MGSQWMLTGYQPTIEVNDNIYPSCGSVVAKVNGPNEPGLPAYVNLPRALGLGKAAYLGASYNPFAPDSDPNTDGFHVRNLKLPGRVQADRLGRRKDLLHSLDTVRRDIDTKGDLYGLDTFYRAGLDMVTDTKAQAAFDIAKESPKLREKYGRHDLGQCCLLARRLVEAGVTFVTIQAGGGWDTHGNNFKELKDKLLPKFDQVVAALVSDLSETPQSLSLRLAAAPAAGVADYIEILKPRVMSLVVFTGLVGLVLAPGHLHPLLATIAVLCIATGAGAAGAINMWYDRDIDAVMRRTASRPLPAGRMMPGEALGFANDQHERHRGQSAHPRMSHQALCLGTFLRLLLNRSRQLGDGRIDAIQDFQQIAPATTRPGSQGQ